jgi:hypothetical protein
MSNPSRNPKAEEISFYPRDGNENAEDSLLDIQFTYKGWDFGAEVALPGHGSRITSGDIPHVVSQVARAISKHSPADVSVI